MRSRSILFRATMSRAFVMEKRHVRPQCQLLLELWVLGQIHAVRQSEQKWCSVLCLFQSRFGPSVQTGPIEVVQACVSSWRGMLQCEHTGVRQSFIPLVHEVECLMMSPYCSSSGVPIQFQSFWTLFCFKLVFNLLFR